jgi:HK97 family phage major capsid protein
MDENKPVTMTEVKALIADLSKSFETMNDAREKKFALTNAENDKKALDEGKQLGKTVKFLNAIANGDRKTLKALHKERIEASGKTLNEGTGSAGGYLVPVEFEKLIVKFMSPYNAIRRNSFVLPMTSKTKELTALTGEPTVTVEDELATITATGITFGKPVLTAKKYVAIADWSSEVGEDSAFDLVSLLAERIARAISKKEEEQFIGGTTSGSEGLLKKSGVTATQLIAGDGFEDITWEDLAGMEVALSEVDEAEAETAKYYMSRSVYNVLRVLKASTSGVFFLPVAPTQAQPALAWGHEIVITNQMPKISASAQSTKFVVFADLKKHAFIGDRTGIKMKILSEGTIGSVNLATDDAEAIRVTKRTAFVIAGETGIVTLATRATVSA